MKYAAILKAENDWYAILVNKEGNPNYIEVFAWGVKFGLPSDNLVPLDDCQSSFYEKHNYVSLLNPNDKTSEDNIKLLCKIKAIRLGWIKE